MRKGNLLDPVFLLLFCSVPMTCSVWRRAPRIEDYQAAAQRALAEFERKNTSKIKLSSEAAAEVMSIVNEELEEAMPIEANGARGWSESGQARRFNPNQLENSVEAKVFAIRNSVARTECEDNNFNNCQAEISPQDIDRAASSYLPLPGSGFLDVSSVPPNHMVIVDREQKGNTNVKLILSAGEHFVEVDLETRKCTRTVYIKERETQQFKCSP